MEFGEIGDGADGLGRLISALGVSFRWSWSGEVNGMLTGFDGAVDGRGNLLFGAVMDSDNR